MFVEATIIKTRTLTIKPNTTRETDVVVVTYDLGRFGPHESNVVVRTEMERTRDFFRKQTDNFVKVTGIGSIDNHSEAVGKTVTIQLEHTRYGDRVAGVWK